MKLRINSCCINLLYTCKTVRGEILGNMFCLDFTDRSLADTNSQVMEPVTSYGENRRMLCNKTFCQKIPDFSPDSGFSRNFFRGFIGYNVWDYEKPNFIKIR